MAVSSSGSPNQPIPQPNQLRQYTPQYYVPQSTANGQFICLPGAPTTQPQQQANIGQSTGQLQTGNKGGRGSKTGKDKEQGAKNVPQTQPQNPMMLSEFILGKNLSAFVGRLVICNYYFLTSENS